MGGVGHEGQSDISVGDPVDPLMVHAEVVFDISGALKVEAGTDDTALSPQTGRQVDMQAHCRAGTFPEFCSLGRLCYS